MFHSCAAHAQECNKCDFLYPCSDICRKSCDLCVLCRVYKHCLSSFIFLIFEMALLRHNMKMSLRLFQATSVSFRHKSSEQKLPHYIEHSTGLERKELLARAAGNDDPFGMKVFKRGPGTKDNPNLIPSFEDKRIVGCICEEDSTAINWIWVHKDEPKRCGCGHWFKIVEAKPL